jgi:hypothetical protein
MIAELEKVEHIPFRVWLGSKGQDHKDGESCFLASMTMILCKSEHATYVQRTLCEVIRPSFFACTLELWKGCRAF